MCYADLPSAALEQAAASSRTTHGASSAVDACRYLGALIVGVVQGVSKEELLSPSFSPLPGYWQQYPPGEEQAEVAAGSFKRRQPPEIRGSGYVIASSEAALWAFSRSTTFQEGCLLAVNPGEDADTTGAVYGHLAGAFSGAAGLPYPWLACLAHRALLESLADQLADLAVTLAARARAQTEEV